MSQAVGHSFLCKLIYWSAIISTRQLLITFNGICFVTVSWEFANVGLVDRIGFVKFRHKSVVNVCSIYTGWSKSNFTFWDATHFVTWISTDTKFVITSWKSFLDNLYIRSWMKWCTRCELLKVRCQFLVKLDVWMNGQWNFIRRYTTMKGRARRSRSACSPGFL